jgi:hypothetical protein
MVPGASVVSMYTPTGAPTAASNVATEMPASSNIAMLSSRSKKVCTTWLSIAKRLRSKAAVSPPLSEPSAAYIRLLFAAR